MADTGAPHAIPYLLSADPPSIHGITSAMAAQISARLGFVGKSIVATSQTRTSSTYGTLTTPDSVANVVVPTDGIVQVRYVAQWSIAGTATANAAIFIDSTQVTAPQSNSLADPSIGVLDNASGDRWLSSYGQGLISDHAAGGTGLPASPATTGQIISTIGGTGLPASGGGGACEIYLAAGTYTVSVQFKTSASTLTVKNRKLWVRVLPF